MGDSGGIAHNFSSLPDNDSLLQYESERTILCLKLAHYRVPGPSTNGIDPSARPIDWIQVLISSQVKYSISKVLVKY